MTRIAKIIWIVLCFVVLIYYALNRSVRDSDIFAIYSMIVLSFPAGWAGTALSGCAYWALDHWFGYSAPKDAELLLIWLVTTALGFMQWFVLLPYVFKKIKQRNT